MAKIIKPIRFSDYFNISNETFETHGVLNPTLNMDTDLFISPLLLAESSSEEMRNARNRYETHFTNVIFDIIFPLKLSNDGCSYGLKFIHVDKRIRGICQTNLIPN